MKLLEVKNNLTKIQYDDTDNLVLGGFLVIADEKMPYVSQIMSLKNNEEGNLAIAKLLFTYDNEGIVKNYNGSVPSLTSEISILYSKELLDILPVNIPIKIGQLAQQPFDMIVDVEIFENNLLICLNKIENTNILLDNFVKQFEINEIKSVIFDLDGHIDFPNKIKFSEDFKLPLNYNTINYIYENDLSDIDPTSKAIIQDIFIEVQEYTKSIPNGFIPFETFMEVVDAQYKETKIPQLILLKNKLLKYKESGTFAQTEKEAKSLNNVIEYARNIVLDLSMINSESLQQEIINYAYSIYNNKEIPVNTFVKLDNSYANKPFLKLLTSNNFVHTSIIVGHEFKYLKELKSIAKNMILFTPLQEEHDFAAYNTFLNKLSQDEFILIGDLTQHIPFILQIESFDFYENTEEKVIEQEVQENIIENKINDINNDNLTSVNDDNQELNISQNDEVLQEPQILEEPQSEILDEEPLLEIAENSNNIINFNSIEEQNIISEDENSNISEPELNFETSDADINTSLSDDIQIEESSDLFPTENFENENIEIEQDFDNFDEESLNNEDNSINLINEVEELVKDEYDNEIVEENEASPIIPIYPADETDKIPLEKFNPGEQVTHPKYGVGIVEKMINYGTKKLCSVMFSNNRRRLLDPAISELTKL